MTKVLAGLAVLAAGWALSAWALMLAVRVIHDQWLPVVPPLSYLTAWALSVLLGLRFLVGLAVQQTLRDLTDTPAKVKAAPKVPAR